MDRDIAVRFNSVSFSYGDIKVLDNTSFHIHRGEFAAIVGPNGSGKTTVLKLLFGLEKPNKGSIDIFDAEKKKNYPSSRFGGSSISYVSQQIPADNLFPITVRDIVRMGLLRPLEGYKKNIDSAEEALEKTGIACLASRTYRTLSGGQKRRALVARALAANPDILVLDEPSANMDAESEMMLYETLGSIKGKTTIIIVTHDTEFVTSLTDRVLCMGDGSHTVIQHGFEIDVSPRHGDDIKQARILHDKNIAGDDCCRHE